MYKADNLNIRESAILFEFIKFSLLEQFEEYPEVQQKLLESSDTDILSYAIIGKKSPKFVNTELYENMLLDKLKDIIVDNSHLFNESDIEYTVKDFLNEIGSFKNASANDILQEGLFDNFHIKGQGANEIRKSIANKYRGVDTLNKLGHNLKEKTPAQIKSMYDKVKRNHEDITKYSEDQSKGVQDNKPDASADNPPSKHDLSTHGNTANNEVSGNFLTKWAHNIQHSVESNFPKLYHFVQNHGKAIGGAALVGVAGYLAYKAYQNYFSKAAKACSAKSGEQKEICMKQYKQKATQQQISVLQKSISLCKNATNPIKCKTEIQQKIGKLKQKMA